MSTVTASSAFRRRRLAYAKARRGFTLVEIIVVASLIALLSGIAIFAINTMYNANIKKVTVGETGQFASALSFAQNDLQFYPKLCYLNLALARVSLNRAGTGYSDPRDATNFGGVFPGLDYYGFLSRSPGVLTRIVENWNGPYMGQSLTRTGINRGGTSGLVRMRIPELVGLTVDGQDVSIIDWPADVYGNPYVLYILKTTVESGSIVPEFIEKENEDGDYFTAVVSYGPNKIPGGNGATRVSGAGTAYGQQLKAGALYIEGDDIYGGTGGGTDRAQFTLKSAGATDPRVRLDNDASNQNYVDMLFSLGGLGVATNPAAGEVGIRDRGSDDIIHDF